MQKKLSNSVEIKQHGLLQFFILGLFLRVFFLTQ